MDFVMSIGIQMEFVSGFSQIKSEHHVDVDRIPKPKNWHNSVPFISLIVLVTEVIQFEYDNI